MTGPTTCPCGAPTRDDAYVCEQCLDKLAHIIGSLPAIEAELEHDLVGERSKPVGHNSPSSVPPMPFNPKASELLSELKARTVALVRLCHVEKVRHQSPDTEMPAATIPAMSTWLLWRVDGLAWVTWAPDTLRDFTRLETRAHKFLTPKRPSQYLGTCVTSDAGELCGGSIYAEHGSGFGKCDRADCGQTYAVEATRKVIQDALDDRLFTPAQLATAAMYLDLHEPRTRLLKTVHYWIRHKQLVPVNPAAESADRLYRFADAKVLLYRRFARNG